MKPRGASGSRILHKKAKGALSVARCSNLLDERSGFQLKSSWGHVSALEGGGHICELMLNSVGSVNPMWKPTWKTIDPPAYNPQKHQKIYGPPPEGRLLAGIAGHSISFDFFGPPSEEEMHEQATVHTARLRLLGGADSGDLTHHIPWLIWLTCPRRG